MYGSGNLEESMRRLSLLTEITEQMTAETATIRLAEEDELLRLYGIGAPPFRNETPPDRTSFERTLLRSFSAAENHPKFAMLILYANDIGWIRQLARAYLAIADKNGFKVAAFRWDKKPKADLLNEARDASRPRLLDAAEFDALPGDNSLAALGLEITGETATGLFGGESGLHRKLRPEKSDLICLVEPQEDRLTETYLYTAEVRAIDLRTPPVRREFAASRGDFKDTALGIRERGTFSDDLLADLVHKDLVRRARLAID
jgi:hypothetical protein